MGSKTLSNYDKKGIACRDKKLSDLMQYFLPTKETQTGTRQKERPELKSILQKAYDWAHKRTKV